MNPSPDPLDPTIFQAIEGSLMFAAVGLALGGFVLIVFSAMLIRASRYPMPVPVIAPLAMLSLVTIIIGGLGGPTELIAVGATGLGALAAVLTTVFAPNEKSRSTGGNHNQGPVPLEGPPNAAPDPNHEGE